MNKEDILGFVVTGLSAVECADEVIGLVSAGRRDCHWVACLNPHSYAVSMTDENFSRALQGANWLIPDGVGIVLASRAFRGKIRRRVAGWDVFEAVMARLDAIGGRVMFLGSTDETLGLIREKVASDYPNVLVVGTFSPPFRPSFGEDDNKAMISAVNKANADVLWVGMTAPKQEKWIFHNRDQLDVAVAGAIGAVFDFYAGRVKRSSPVFQSIGMEWLPRLVREPRRLWRRNFISAPVFLFHVLRRLLRFTAPKF